jgi:general stress protein YciG
MAAKKGRGWHGDPDGHKKAGRKGGQATASSHGQDFYSSIGRKGGQVSPGNFANDPQRARAAGQKGGKARKKIKRD